MFHVGMPLKVGANMPECQEIFLRKISSLSQYGVESRRIMPFGQDKTVSVRFLRLGRIDIHLFKIEVC